MRKIIRFIYKKIIKPILFLFPADDIHVLFLKMGNFLGRYKFSRFLTKKIFSFQSQSLNQDILGIDFKNPIGLAAGFDYDADLMNILPQVGFGFETVGTVTNNFYQGNAFPMLGRLPKSKSLLVNKGFKSNGIDFVLKKINKRKKYFPLGISIGATNKKYETEDGMREDFYQAFERATNEQYFDYFEINISCPNLIHLPEHFIKFDSKEGFKSLLDKISEIKIDKPVFIKMHSEKSVEDTLDLCEIAENYKFVSGFIFSNLVKDRNNKNLNREEIEKLKDQRGNFSGKPTEELANNLISEVYKKYKDTNRFIIIGCGGVFEGKDAYEKIKRGASLVQMITGMIYEGPSQIGIINKELVDLLNKDGYKNISEAIGVYYK
ncbi:MAG: dihydroorotate dehydrogenase (quinone) [Candidatus Paceibacterota bacterium]|jgi:dihydroorotate dehydrogenase subfamily 2